MVEAGWRDRNGGRHGSNPTRSVLRAVLLAGTVCGCGGGGGSSEPIIEPPPPDPDTSLSFTEQATSAGLARAWGYTHTDLSDPEYMASGLAAVDYDADGDTDIYVAGGDLEPNRLFQNQGDGTFVDVAAEVGLDLVHKGSGPTFADTDKDGDLDLFVGAVEHDPYYLMENRGGTFVDVTATSGLDILAANTFSAALADYDEDGDLDMALAHWGNPELPDTETLWRNTGDGTFESYSIQSRIAEVLIDSSDPEELQIRAPAFRRDNSFTPNFADIDSDGDLDLLMASDFRTSQVFSNDGDGTFTLATDREVIKDQAGMGAAVADYDNDGDLDWFVTSIYKVSDDDLSGFGNRLYANDGGVFTDVTDTAGVANGGWGWGACFADFDNDGHQDILHVNGWREESDEPDNNYVADRVRLFRSNADGTFTDVAQASGLTDQGQGRGVACFDADRDGDIDVVITNNGDKALLYYRNDSDNENRYLAVQLDGFGIGARVTVTAGGRTQIQEMRAGNNYVSQNPFELHFGLGTAASADVTVDWLDGTQTALTARDADQLITVSTTGERTALRLIVDSGVGSGFYEPGDEITVTAADAADGYHFYHWSSTNGTFADRFARETTFTMPEGNAVVTANYVPGVGPDEDVSVARRWKEVLLESIRNDFARPTVHARNLFHVSGAMYDAWAAYAEVEATWLLGRERAGTHCAFESLADPSDADAARREAMSHAAYRLILHRFADSPGDKLIRRNADALMGYLGFDASFDATDYATTDSAAAALGNHVAACYIAFGLADGANEADGYANQAYEPVNPALEPAKPGNPDIVDRNRWQPLKLEVAIDQSGNTVDPEPAFIGPEWGSVVPFALAETDLTTYDRDGWEYKVYHDPGPPPAFDGSLADQYQWNFALVAAWASHLSTTDGVTMDISPASVGNIDDAVYPTQFESFDQFFDLREGGDPGEGYEINPATGEPYAAQVVPRGDYARVLAEFWADGPDSETPPGHWFVIANEVNDHPSLARRYRGGGVELDKLEWDAKLYFVLGGAMHDVAVTAWGIKGFYDYIRPISALRAMADLGQGSDPDLPAYHIDGITLIDGLIELVGADDPLAGDDGEHVDKIKLYTWRGHDVVEDPETEVAGVGWILAENWWPYQRPTFVTPPFAGYVSGHSTYSRAAAEVLAAFTGDDYFPGGMSGFEIRRNEFLVFEDGPTVDLRLEWARYRDAADQCSLSRIWGGIHPPADDIPGRLIGREVGLDAFELADRYFRDEID